jgi:hypothetical protein
MTALMSAVATATAAVPRLQPMNGVVDKTYPYGVYSATFGRGDTYTNDGTEGVRWGRIVLQTFGRTTDSATDLYDQARAALVGKVLTVDGSPIGPITGELDPAVTRDPDDAGVVGVTTTFTFTATEE